MSGNIIKFISTVYLCATESDHSNNPKVPHTTTTTTKQEDWTIQNCNFTYKSVIFRMVL